MMFPQKHGLVHSKGEYPKGQTESKLRAGLIIPVLVLGDPSPWRTQSLHGVLDHGSTILLHSLFSAVSLANGHTAEFMYITQDLSQIVHHPPLCTHTRK